MIAIDANILVYAHRQDSPWHAPARQVISELAMSRTPWAIPWHCIHEFFATVTKPRGYRPPSTTKQAIDQIDAWLASPMLTLLGEDLATWTLLSDLLRGSRIVGAAIYDARIAALCLRHGVTELWTHDRDFSRFPGLRARNPLVDIQPTGAREPRAGYGTRPTSARVDRRRKPARGGARSAKTQSATWPPAQPTKGALGRFLKDR